MNLELKFVLKEYKELFDGSGNNPGEKTLEDKFFEYEVSSFFVLFCDGFHHRLSVAN